VLLADIRFCTKDNVEQILTVDRTSLYPWPERVIIHDLIESDARLFYMGAFASTKDEKLLGYAVFGDESGKGLLMNLVILPEYRRFGIGSQLVVAVSECAIDWGFRELVLRVRSSNFAAMALYRVLGFQIDARRENFYSNGDVAQFMSVKLPLTIKDTYEEG
jgi:ribosomal-protein-alanine N-acetyltransferase